MIVKFYEFSILQSCSGVVVYPEKSLFPVITMYEKVKQEKGEK